MTSAHWQELKAILAAALEEREGERQMFVENACGSDTDLACEALAFLRYAKDTADALWLGGRFALIDAAVPAAEVCVAPAPAAVPDAVRAG